jgi:hypothetical protein
VQFVLQASESAADQKIQGEQGKDKNTDSNQYALLVHADEGERMKTCKKCGVSKFIEAYRKHHGMADGRRNECSECQVADKRAVRAANREHYNQYERNRKRAIRERNAKPPQDTRMPYEEFKRMRDSQQL